MLFPVWVLLTALILQFVESLRGVYMFDPLTGTIEFQAYGVFRQWGAAGMLSLVLLGVVVPIVANLLYLMDVGHDAAVQIGNRTATRYAEAVGPAVLDVPLEVRKRSRSGAVLSALPLQVVIGSAWRRGLARVLDAGLVFFGLAGALVAGTVLDHRTLLIPEALGPWTLSLAGFVLVALYLARWRVFAQTGQSVGKMLLDVHVVPPVAASPGWMRRVVPFRTGLLREVLPDLLVLAGATGFAWLLGRLAYDAVVQAGGEGMFDPARATLVLRPILWGVAFGLFEGVLGLPMLFDGQSARDRLAGTKVLRTTVVSVRTADPLLARRVLARMVDLILVGLVGLLPLALSVLGAFSGKLLLGVAALEVLVVGGLLVGLLVDLGRNGSTPGKRLFGLQVVDRHGGAVDSWVRMVLVREVMCVGLFWTLLPVVAPLYDLLTGALDDDERTLHDWVAGTRVVAVPSRSSSTQ